MTPIEANQNPSKNPKAKEQSHFDENFSQRLSLELDQFIQKNKSFKNFDQAISILDTLRGYLRITQVARKENPKNIDHEILLKIFKFYSWVVEALLHEGLGKLKRPDTINVEAPPGPKRKSKADYFPKAALVKIAIEPFVRPEPSRHSILSFLTLGSVAMEYYSSLIQWRSELGQMPDMPVPDEMIATLKMLLITPQLEEEINQWEENKNWSSEEKETFSSFHLNLGSLLSATITPMKTSIWQFNQTLENPEQTPALENRENLPVRMHPLERAVLGATHIAVQYLNTLSLALNEPLDMAENLPIPKSSVKPEDLVETQNLIDGLEEKLYPFQYMRELFTRLFFGLERFRDAEKNPSLAADAYHGWAEKTPMGSPEDKEIKIFEFGEDLKLLKTKLPKFLQATYELNQFIKSHLKPLQQILKIENIEEAQTMLEQLPPIIEITGSLCTSIFTTPEAALKSAMVADQESIWIPAEPGERSIDLVVENTLNQMAIDHLLKAIKLNPMNKNNYEGLLSHLEKIHFDSGTLRSKFESRWELTRAQSKPENKKQAFDEITTWLEQEISDKIKFMRFPSIPPPPDELKKLYSKAQPAISFILKALYPFLVSYSTPRPLMHGALNDLYE